MAEHPPEAGAGSKRSLLGYLAVPRVVELCAHGMLMPAGYITGRLGDTPPGATAGAVLVAWVAFEYCLYQARYLANDLIDLPTDQQHAAAGGRRRAPRDSRVRRWGAAVIAARVAVAAALIALLPGNAQTVTIVAALGLLSAALGYEAARMPGRRRPGIREPMRLSWREALVFGLIGSGYGLRFAFGVALAGATGGVIAAAVAFGWTFGITLTVITWMREGAWLRAVGDVATLARKSHVALLAQLVPEGRAATELRLFASPSARRLAAGLFAVASACAVVAGVSLDRSPGAATIVVLTGVWVVISPLVIASWPSSRAGALVVGLDAAVATALVIGGSEPALVALAVVLTEPLAVLMSAPPALLGLSASPDNAATTPDAEGTADDPTSAEWIAHNAATTPDGTAGR